MHREIEAYRLKSRGKHDRYRSWEHCFGYFQTVGPSKLCDNREQAALQLGFYLASWGMYRGSSFLLNYTHTVHASAVDVLCDSRFRQLWETEFGTDRADLELVPLVMDLVLAIREAYRPFVPDESATQPTDTLVTKIALGTLGCLPACDRFFVEGFKIEGFKFSYFNRLFVERVLSFCEVNKEALKTEQASILEQSGVFYPFMKLADMYFWQRGMGLAASTKGQNPRV